MVTPVSLLAFFRNLSFLDHAGLLLFLPWKSVALIHGTIEKLVLDLCLEADQLSLYFLVHVDGVSHVLVSGIADVVAVVCSDL